MVTWVANIILRDIAKLSDFVFDLDTRSLYVQVHLAGEPEVIEVWLDDFAIVTEEESHHFIIKKAKSNRLWLNNLLARISNKAWKIPNLPQFASYIELASEVLEAQKMAEEQEQNNEIASV